MSVLAITHEGQRETEKFARVTNMGYAYAYEKAGKLMRELGAKGFPTAVLVDPAGVVRWKGHPARLTNELVESVLDGAFEEPIWTWPKQGKKARKALAKFAWGDAFEELAELEEDWADAAATKMRVMASAWLESGFTALEKGDYLAVSRTLDLGKKRLKGFDDLELRMERLDDMLDAQDNVKKVISLQEKLEDLRSTELRSKNQAEKLLEQVEAFLKKAEGTYAAEEAQAFAEDLRKMLGR